MTGAGGGSFGEDLSPNPPYARERDLEIVRSVKQAEHRAAQPEDQMAASTADAQAAPMADMTEVEL